MRELMVRDAIREALDEEMARDNTVFQMGEDIGVIGGNFKCTVGLRDKYGDLRVKDTPISEQGFVGMGVGAALTGLRPVVELMFADFMMVCGDQLFNQMAKITYMSGGQCNVPMVVRLPLGGGRSSAAQHSQSIHAWAAHIPGVKVVVPSTAGECKGLLKTAIRDNDPVMFFEHKMLYTTKFNDVPEVEEDVCIPFGRARIVAEGADITVVTNSMMTIKAEKAVRQLQKEGISAELIDLRTIVPLDTETIIRSVKKTGKLLIVDEGHLSFGITGEIASRIMPDVFYDLDAPIQRMGTADVPLPFSPALEFPLIPDEKKIAAKIREMVYGGIAMAEVVIMPKLGFNMDEGQLVKWHKQVGETVKKGEVLFEINTDKTTMPVEATEDGTLLKIILEEGAFAEVFTPIAVTGAPGEDPDAALASAGQGQAGGSAPAAAPSAPAAPVDMKSLKLTPKARKLVQDEGIDPASLTQIKGTGFQGGITYKDLKASPLARRVARQMGVDLAAVQGTGAAGKIMKADVEAAAAKAAPASAGSDTRQVASAVPYKGVRRIIGEKLAQSKFTAPHLYFTDAVDTTELAASASGSTRPAR